MDVLHRSKSEKKKILFVLVYALQFLKENRKWCWLWNLIVQRFSVRINWKFIKNLLLFMNLYVLTHGQPAIVWTERKYTLESNIWKFPKIYRQEHYVINQWSHCKGEGSKYWINYHYLNLKGGIFCSQLSSST